MAYFTIPMVFSFNPSFLLDGLGIFDELSSNSEDFCFNPSFLLDGLGIFSNVFGDIPFFVSILVSYWMGWELMPLQY